MKVLMIGNDKSVHGGITSVISQILKFDWKQKGITMNFIPSYKNGNFFSKIIYFLRQICKISVYIKKERPDIVHIHMSHTGSFSRANIIQKICLKNNVKTVVHLHGSEFQKFYKESSEKKKKQIKKFFENTTCTIVLGKNWKNFISSIAPKSKIEVFNNSVYIPKDYIVKQCEKEINFLYMGVLIKRKGVMDLLQAIKNISEREEFKKYNISFNICGVGEEEERLKKYVEENKLDENVKFLGWIEGERKKEIFKNNHVFILPSYNEGLPIAILEALSYGMPIISTNVGSIDEAVFENKNGYLFQPGDISKLEEIIIKIINNHSARVEMGKYSKEIANMNFDEDIYFEKMINIYNM